MLYIALALAVVAGVFYSSVWIGLGTGVLFIAAFYVYWGIRLRLALKENERIFYRNHPELDRTDK